MDTIDAASLHPVRAEGSAWLALAILMVPVFMTAVDMSVLFLAMPAIAADLLPSGTQQLWVLHIGDIAGASLVLAAGRAVDRFGPRRLLILGLISYGVASSLAAFAPTIEILILILARMLLGAAAVSITPAAAAILRRLFPHTSQFSTAIALLMAAFSGGMALGPPLGGLLLEHFWWGSIFLFNVPIAIGVLCAWRLLPRIEGERGGRIDTLSIALSASGIICLVYGVQEIASEGWNGWRVLIALIGILLIGLFVLRQRRLADPLLDISLFRSVPFSLGLLSIWLVISAGAGADMQLPQHLQVVLGLSPSLAGVLLVVPAVLSMLATAAAPRLLRWFRPGTVIGAGALASIAGSVLALFAIASGTEAPITILVVAAGVLAIGAAPVFALGTNIVLANAPQAQTGSAQSMQEVSGSLGNTTGLALGGTVAYLSYSNAMHETVPGGIKASTAKQSAESIGGAVAGAEDLPPTLGSHLMDTATAAFTIATRDTYLVAIAGFVLLALLGFWGLRKARVEIEVEVEEIEIERGSELDDTAATLRRFAATTPDTGPCASAIGTSLSPLASKALSNGGSVRTRRCSAAGNAPRFPRPMRRYGLCSTAGSGSTAAVGSSWPMPGTISMFRRTRPVRWRRSRRQHSSASLCRGTEMSRPRVGEVYAV